ncbi:MAG: Y-family DNA polymerase, partial [Polyangiaceae bacterium]
MSLARRIAAISLSSLRLEIARQIEPALANCPLAIVVARENSAIENEASLLGNTRLDEASREAKYLGTFPGMTIAAARAKSSDLSVRVVAERAAKDALARIAELALAFGATVAFDTATHVVWADVTGCAHIHDPDLHRGENILAHALFEKVSAQGHEASVAISDGPRVAAIFSKVLASYEEEEHVLVVPREKTKDAILALPVDVLPLDEAAKHWLSRLGIKTAADLAKLPRASLASRLGPQSRSLFSLFDASDTTPLDPYRPPETPLERFDLEYGIEGGEALLFVMRTLSSRMSARLEGRALGATEISITFELDDAARSGSKIRRSRVDRKIVLAAPIRNAADLFAVVRARIEAAERRRETFTAPILAVELAATKLSRAPSRNLDLLETESRAARLLPQLAAELAADLGENRAGMLVLESSLDPLERVRLVPYEERNESLSVSEDIPEPSRFLQGDACELMM